MHDETKQQQSSLISPNFLRPICNRVDFSHECPGSSESKPLLTTIRSLSSELLHHIYHIHCLPVLARAAASLKLKLGFMDLWKVMFLVLLVRISALIGRASALTWDQEFTVPHNAARKAVGVAMPDLVWDWNLAKYAQNWTDRQASPQNNCKLVHSGGPYGENIYWASWSSTPLDAVQAWVAEKAYYNYATNSCTAGKICGHYTQVVWKTTTKVGCASSKCPAGGTFTLCSYSPPGNWLGKKPY